MMDNENSAPNSISSNSLVTTPVSPKTPSGSKTLTFLSVILSLLLIVSITGNVLQYLGYIDSFKGIHTYLPSWSNIPQVKDYGLYFYIETNLKELKNVSGDNLPGDVEVVTEIQGPGLPKFYLGQETGIFINENNAFKKVSQDQLQPGQRIGILMNYYYLKEWGLPRITILP